MGIIPQRGGAGHDGSAGECRGREASAPVPGRRVQAVLVAEERGLRPWAATRTATTSGSTFRILRASGARRIRRLQSGSCSRRSTTELDRVLSEMQQQKATGQPLFQFPVVPALSKGQQAVPQGVAVPPGPPPLPGGTAHHGAATAQHGSASAHHGAAAAHHGSASAHHGAAAAHHGSAVPLYGGAAAPQGAAMPGAVVPRSTASPRGGVTARSAAAQQGAMAPSQWADRALPPIDKALLPSSLLPVTPPPVATPKPPADAKATARRRPWMPTWLMVLLAVLAVSMPFVLAALLRRETPPKEQAPAPPSSGAPARSTQAPPEASELLPPAAPAPPEEAEPGLEDTPAESEPPAPAPLAPARPARAAPSLPPAPPTERPLADDVME
ncbi:hypothetical protein [Sorangium sp. So ce1151]|uniref:hypothetical protein n=1 Tax=Sorangium sp. So ce1151 TaxID=3133332 RepID=UPI003F5D7E59